MTQQLESSITVVAANWYNRCFDKEIEFDQYIENEYQQCVVARKYDVPKRGLFGRMKPAQVQDKVKWIEVVNGTTKVKSTRITCTLNV